MVAKPWDSPKRPTPRKTQVPNLAAEQATHAQERCNAQSMTTCVTGIFAACFKNARPSSAHLHILEGAAPQSAHRASSVGGLGPRRGEPTGYEQLYPKQASSTRFPYPPLLDDATLEANFLRHANVSACAERSVASTQAEMPLLTRLLWGGPDAKHQMPTLQGFLHLHALHATGSTNDTHLATSAPLSRRFQDV